MNLIKQQKAVVSWSFVSALVALIIAIIAFLFIANEITIENEHWFDNKAFEFLRGHSSPTVIQIFKFITFFGSTNFIFPSTLVICVYLVLKNRPAIAIQIALLNIVSTLLMHLFKYIYSRQRPDQPLIQELSDSSFPSGHALNSFVFCCSLVYLVWKSNQKKTVKIIIGVLLLTLALGVGISRIVLRYHYASDVLAGFSLGLAWVSLFVILKRILKPINKETRRH